MFLRQRFSITDVFQKGRKFSRNNKQSSVEIENNNSDQESMKMESDSNRASMDLEDVEFEDPSNQNQTGKYLQSL